MKRRKKRAIVWGMLILALCIMAFAGYKLWETQRMYTAGNQNYEALRDLVQEVPVDLSDGLAELTEDPDTSAGEPLVEIPKRYIDFDALKKINPDAQAWLYCPDTVIDYPIMQATDYNWYLHHLPDGTYNANGTLFLDYNNPADFSGGLNIIYGHHMQSGRMFGTLVRYKQQVYFDEHPYMYLYTAENGSYRIDLIYGCVIGAGEWRDRAFMYEANLTSLLSYAARSTTFESGAEYADDDRFLVLSTCSYEFDDARYVVIGVLRPEWKISSRALAALPHPSTRQM